MPQVQTDCIRLGVVIKGFHLTLFFAEGTKVAGPMLGESRQPPRPVSAKVEDG